jgi:hypothetical protein
MGWDWKHHRIWREIAEWEANSGGADEVKVTA